MTKRRDIERFFTSAFPWTTPSFSDQALQKIVTNVRNSTGDETLRSRLKQAVRVAADIERERGIHFKNSDPFISNPLLISERLVDYNASENEVLAAILYSSVRPYADESTGHTASYDPKYIDRIRKEFGPEVADHVLETLQYYETNLLTRPAIPAFSDTFEAQTEEERISHFGHMLDEVLAQISSNHSTRDKGWAALRIRGAEWLQGLVNLAVAKQGNALTEEEHIKYIRPATYIDMPVLSRAYAKAQFEGEDGLAMSLMNLHNDIGFLCLQLADPLKFAILSEMVDSRQNQFLRTTGKGKTIANSRGRKALIGKVIEDEIRGCLPPELQRFSRIVVRPQKSILSLQRKFEQKFREGVPMHAVDTGDIIACRIVVQHPHPDVYKTLERLRSDPYMTPSEKSSKLIRAKKEEYPLVVQIKEGLNNQFQFVEGRTKDFICDPTQGGKHEDNGYQAVHVTLEYRKIPMEVQIMGRAMDYDNMFGPAAHIRYKGFEHYHDADRTISVWGPDNNIYRMPQGATVADFLTKLGPDFAFSVDSFSIQRSMVFGLPENPRSFATPLLPGDKIGFTQNPEYAFYPEHRQNLIQACGVYESREALEEANKYYLPHQPGNMVFTALQQPAP